MSEPWHIYEKFINRLHNKILFSLRLVNILVYVKQAVDKSMSKENSTLV